jgi:hypothetical protein
MELLIAYTIHNHSKLSQVRLRIWLINFSLVQISSFGHTQEKESKTVRIIILVSHSQHNYIVYTGILYLGYRFRSKFRPSFRPFLLKVLYNMKC